jgi:hypothetical protein
LLFSWSSENQKKNGFSAKTGFFFDVPIWGKEAKLICFTSNCGYMICIYYRSYSHHFFLNQRLIAACTAIGNRDFMTGRKGCFFAQKAEALLH